MAESGWQKVEESADLKEEEIRHIFNLIDKDHSGYLNQNVKHAFNQIQNMSHIIPDKNYKDEINFRRLIKHGS